MSYDGLARATRGHVTTVMWHPAANFYAVLTTTSTRTAVQFYDASNYATSWLWDFGDGTTSTEQNPLHLYTAAGTYSVTLTVNGYANKVRTDYITVIASAVKLVALESLIIP